jgi:sialic acid synthase SpsE
MFDPMSGTRVWIASEIHPQHGGDMEAARTMILQSKLGGANAVKVQLYDTMALHGNLDKTYLQMDRDEFEDLKKYADGIGIELFASVFDEERLRWCEELGAKRYKIASRTVEDQALCQAIIETGKPVMISLGMYDWSKGFPFEGDNLIYLHCVSTYPAMLEDVHMPSFGDNGFLGYSDHAPGIAACLYAVSRGARFLEKHFTLSTSNQRPTEKAHLGSMDTDDLRQLRILADDLSRLHCGETDAEGAR